MQILLLWSHYQSTSFKFDQLCNIVYLCFASKFSCSCLRYNIFWAYPIEYTRHIFVSKFNLKFWVTTTGSISLLQIDNMEKQNVINIVWEEVECNGPLPPQLAYHNAAVKGIVISDTFRVINLLMVKYSTLEDLQNLKLVQILCIYSTPIPSHGVHWPQKLHQIDLTMPVLFTNPF